MPPEPVDAGAPVRAQLGVGTVRHARRRPSAHAFAYPAYFVRLPMRRLATAFGGQRVLRHNRLGLLSFHDADHGDPRAPGPLVPWLLAMLAGEGIDDADGEIWLQTFPRVLGYAFKPVSFWFCERRDGRVRAIVCEINNTFGERHCYLLAHRDGRPIADGEELVATKVFHVSPFCESTGRYRFRFLHARGRVVARIEYDDATACTDGHGPLIATSLSGALSPVSDRALWSAFVRMPLFSFGVVARIHWQAVRLWMRRTPFFTKPAPPAVQVSR